MLPDNYIPDSLKEASDLLQDVRETMAVIPSAEYEMIMELEEFCLDRIEAVARYFKD